MSLFKKNSLAVALVGAAVFSVVATQGCSSDEQNKPAGSGGSSHAGSGGKTSTAGTAGKPMSEGGAAGEATPGDAAGMGGEMSMGGEGGSGPGPDCDLSFDNKTLTAITDNGGELPPLH